MLVCSYTFRRFELLYQWCVSVNGSTRSWCDVEFFFLPCRGPWLCWRSLLSSLPTPWSFARCTAHKPRLPGETHGNCLLHFSLLSCFFSATQQTYRKQPVEKMGRVYAKTVCGNLDSAGLIFFFLLKHKMFFIKQEKQRKMWKLYESNSIG